MKQSYRNWNERAFLMGLQKNRTVIRKLQLSTKRIGWAVRVLLANHDATRFALTPWRNLSK